MNQLVGSDSDERGGGLQGSRTASHATPRNAPTCRSHPPSWFQLAKVRLTNPRYARPGSPRTFSGTPRLAGSSRAGTIPSGLTTITIQRHQRPAVGCCGDRRQESNRDDTDAAIGESAHGIRCRRWSAGASASPARRPGDLPVTRAMIAGRHGASRARSLHDVRP